MKPRVTPTLRAIFVSIGVVTACGLAVFANGSTGNTSPDHEGTKAIGEEGFIYGLPLEMNSSVIREYAVDKNSGESKVPFNQFLDEVRIFTYKDTAIPVPDSPIYLDMRLYWPKPTPSLILPIGEGTLTPPGIVKSHCHAC